MKRLCSVAACVWMAVFSSALAGCRGSSAALETPEPRGSADSTLRRWIAAVDRNQPSDAYSLLDADVQRRTPYAEFVLRWKSSTSELRVQADALRKRLGASPPVEQARVRYTDGATVALSRSGAGWRLERPFAAGAVATTPWEAVQQFTEALANRNFGKTLRLVVGPLRDRMERELDDHVQALLRAKRGDLQKLSATRYRLRFGDYWLELQRDKGTWKIAHME